MPFLLESGTAVARATAETAEYVSWIDLAVASGNPSLADEASHGAKAYYREQAQQTILTAYNARRAAT